MGKKSSTPVRLGPRWNHLARTQQESTGHVGNTTSAHTETWEPSTGPPPGPLDCGHGVGRTTCCSDVWELTDGTALWVVRVLQEVPGADWVSRGIKEQAVISYVRHRSGRN